ncbi:MAG: heavy metal translocating P-type ATPase [Acholeplasmataceae bacterium]
MQKKQLIFETTNVIIAIILMITAWLLSMLYSSTGWYVILLYALAFAFGGFAKAKEGVLKTIEKKALNVEILMILAALGAFIVKDYAEGAILILIFAISGVLESYATSKSEKALTSLLTLAPRTANLLVNGEEKIVPVEDILIGNHVVVKVGQQVPVDGKIISGSTSLDQAAITGEFIPVPKTIGSDVFAGSVNIESTIIVETTVDSKDTVVQKIINLVKNAQDNKTDSQSLIDKIEKYYVYIVILLSITFMLLPPALGWLSSSEAFRRGIVVLVVGSPCALVASITPAMLSSLSNAAHKRILIKGGKHLEDLLKIDSVVLDKTGTITTGVPAVVRIETISSVNHDYVMDILYTLEKQSSHPLAKSIVEHLENSAKTLDIETKELSGRGMEAKIDNDIWKIGRFDAKQADEIITRYNRCTSLGHSTVNIIKNDEIVGFVALMDTLREGVSAVVDELKSMGIKSYLVTGDNEFTARYVAKESHVDNYVANCFPEDKVKIIEKIQSEGGHPMMLGDGINDAPALATADIGIAMGAGTDVSLETADIIFMNNNMENLPKLIKLAKRMRRITLQNVIFAVSVITLLMISNVFGIIELPMGVVFHEGSTILVILNSLRLLIK